MGGERRPGNSLAVSDDLPLIGVVFFEDGRETARYFCREEDIEAEIRQAPPRTRWPWPARGRTSTGMSWRRCLT